MKRRTVGLVLLNLAGALVIVGALYDLLVPSVPANHIVYLGAVAGGLDPRYAELDLAMLRSIGGCLLAAGVTTLILANGPVRKGERWSVLTAALLVGVAEGNNAYRMYPFNSPWYGPLGFAVLAIAGAALVMPPRRASGGPNGTLDRVAAPARRLATREMPGNRHRDRSTTGQEQQHERLPNHRHQR